MHPIERYRKARGMTQGALAEAVGTSLSTVQRWEAGSEPRPSRLLKIAAALDIDTMRLLDELTSWRQQTKKAS